MFESDFTKLESDKLIEYAQIVDEWTEPSYLEIGVFKGGSLLKVLENTEKLQCFGIDLFEDFCENKDNTHVTGTISKEELRLALFDKWFADRVSLYKGDSRSEIQEFGINRLNGLILIDGNHKFHAALTDFILSYNVLKRGYILMHNASTHMYPDKDYVECDGGPNRVLSVIQSFPGIEYIGMFDRLAVLSKIV